MKPKTVLVTGGAGYIGSHMTRLLLRLGLKPVVLDNLSKGHKSLIPRQAVFETVDLLDAKALDRVFTKYKIDAVIHFGGLIAVGESVQVPLTYYENNINGSIHLIQAAVKHKVGAFIFSSTAAVYKPSGKKKLIESGKLVPQSPYGWSKLFVEQILADAFHAHGLKYMCLRYFNACGADAAGETGEWHEPETHLIPNILKAQAAGRAVSIFGDDYPTKDGTCLRDYIHVEDLCEGHWAALEALSRGTAPGAFNLGTGHGKTVLEVVQVAREVTGQDVAVKIIGRRAGDAVALVADVRKAKKVLNWSAKRTLHQAVTSAYRWEKQLISLK